LEDDNPFLSYAFLEGLERTGCVTPENGWQPFHLTLWREEKLLAAMPAYLKSHSFGEFVFDWSWANAYEQHGLRYYPKLLCAVPMTPIGGPRILAASNQELKATLAASVPHWVEKQQLSSAHINFTNASDSAIFDGLDRFAARRDIQFHWHNQDYRDFDDFLSRLNAKKRKNIRQERRAVIKAGWHFERVSGAEVSSDQIALMHRLYLSTFDKKGGWAPLSLDFFQYLTQSLPKQTLFVFAHHADLGSAGALFFRSNDALYGRYWGTAADSPGLHFETCYYQGIEYAIENRLSRFEPGAQGQHKLARGFVPTETRSYHFMHHPDFHRAICRAIEAEREHHESALTYYLAHLPFRRSDTEGNRQ